jgi:hypothetical protein
LVLPDSAKAEAKQTKSKAAASRVLFMAAARAIRSSLFADYGHISRSHFPGDVHPLAFTNRGLGVVGGYVHDLTLLMGPTTFGGQRWNRKANHKSRNEKISSHR